MFAKVALGVTGLVYAAMAYMYIFNVNGLFAAFGFELGSLSGSALGGVVVALTRYVGASCFLIAFILLHMIPNKASAGLRTAIMTCALYGGVAAYRAFLEDGVSAAAIEATKKNVYLQGGLLIMNVAALMSLPKEDKSKRA